MTMPGQSRGQVSWVDEGRGALPRPRRSTSPRLNCPWSSRGRSANAYCRRPVWTRRIPRLSVGGVYGEMTMARLAWFLVLVGSLFALCGCGGRSNTTTPGDGGTDATTGDASAGCKTNADCANSADGALCNTRTHACGCNAASDCASSRSGNVCPAGLDLRLHREGRLSQRDGLRPASAPGHGRRVRVRPGVHD